MTLLRVDASIQGDQSASSALADQVLDQFVTARPDVPVVTRHLGQQPLPADAWASAIGGNFTPEADRTEAQRTAIALAQEIAGELQSAEAAVLALPLYNWGVSQHVKTWIDLALAGAPHGAELLQGKPVTLIVTRGGAYGPGTPKEGWDHSVGYLRRIVEEVWGAELTLIERELTLVGVNPALDAFADLAAQMHSTAQELAAKAGADLAARHSA